MIITWLTGGLGNQMFQYAAGLALAEERRTIHKLDATWFRDHPEYPRHVRYALSCLQVSEQFATDEEIDRVRGTKLTRTERWSVALARRLRLYRYAQSNTFAGNWHQPPTFAYYPEFLQQPDPTYLNGMFQSERFFEKYAPLVRQHFTFRYPPTPAVQAMADRIRSGPSIAINIRRGDYVSNPQWQQVFGTLGGAYYHRALAVLRARSPRATVYVFSDEIDVVAREFIPDAPHEYVRCVESWHVHDYLRLMGLCDHIAIANSSFSWWAAWLNSSPEKLVIAPDPWFANSPHDTRDLVPASWHKLSVNP